uniref:HAP1 N-terminal domain-containing protein n=1 Tax=Macrostomum lignano TaxID=282301 RepID=A0A1I8FMU4_9PLAT
ADQEWRRELQRLREENSSLKQALSEARRGNSSSASEQSAGSATSSPVQHRQQQQHLLIVARLKSALNAQRDETRILRRELANSRADCEPCKLRRLSKSVRRGGGGGVGDLEDKFCDDRSDSDSSDCQPELHRGDADMVTSSIEEDPSNSTPLSGFEVISSSSFYQALPSAPLLGGEPGVGLTSQASPAPARHDCRASGAEKNDGGGSNGDASNQKSNSSDLGIKY